MTLAVASGSAFEWYLTRATGAVALVLLTGAIALGVVELRRWQTPRWPRFVVDSLHRNIALLALAFVGVHVLSSILDSFAPVSLAAAFIPFISPYRPFWLGLGAVALDLTLAVILTSLLRDRIGYRGWRVTHWLVYATWPIALLHGLGTGSDVKSGWLLALSITCTVIVLAAIAVRTLSGWPQRARLRGAALAGAGAFTLALALWLPVGPLGHEWARRSGTPTALLKHTERGAAE